MTAARLPARRFLCAVDPWQASLRQAAARGAFQSLPVGHVSGGFLERLKHGLRPLERSAQRMEPQRHLAFREGIWKAFPEAQLALRDRLAATAAL